MPEISSPLSLLSAMITPAVLISACGTLILSTSTRLARVVDRVRVLVATLQELFAEPGQPFGDSRRDHAFHQLELQTRRAQLLQRALTTFYVALSIFVGTTVSIVVLVLAPRVSFLPSLLGVTGTLALLHGCVTLIGETRLALRSVDLEMAFALRLRELYQQQPT